MPLRLTNALQADIYVGINYRLTVIHDPVLVPALLSDLGALDTENEKRIFESDFAYFYNEETSSGPGHVGTLIGNWPPTAEYVCNVSLFCPFGGFRYPELDRAPWGSAQVSSAYANMSVGSLFKFYERSVTWAVNDERQTPDGPDTNPAYFDSSDLGSISAALNGFKLIGGELKLTQLGFIGNFQEQQAGKTKKTPMAEFVKVYLDRRNDFEAFAITVIPGTGAVTEPNPVNPYESLRAIYSATVIDTRVYTEDLPDNPGSFFCTGALEAKYNEFDSVALGSEIVGFDLSSWTMNDNSRVSPGICSSKV